MPIYEFECQACGVRFEDLVGFDATPPCPACGATGARRLLSQVFPTPSIGLRGGDAKRVDARRLGEKTRQKEQRAAARERKQRG